MSEIIDDRLLPFLREVERIEHLEEEKRGLGDDLKSTGYDVKTVRSIVKLRRLESHARQEAEALLETYKAALGLD